VKALKLVGIGVVGVAGFAALAIAILIGWLTIMDPFGGDRHPTDAEMLAQFRQHRAELETIVDMLRADPQVERLAPDFTRPDPAPISAERLADYRKRLAAAGIRHGLSRYGNDVTFIVSARGLEISGSAKSFAYVERAYEDAVLTDGDLDAAAARSPTSEVIFARRIEGNWWLQLDRR
jgi:hypothetical protein